jgi:hypothetical protein
LLIVRQKRQREGERKSNSSKCSQTREPDMRRYIIDVSDVWLHQYIDTIPICTRSNSLHV